MPIPTGVISLSAASPRRMPSSSSKSVIASRLSLSPARMRTPFASSRPGGRSRSAGAGCAQLEHVADDRRKFVEAVRLLQECCDAPCDQALAQVLRVVVMSPPLVASKPRTSGFLRHQRKRGSPALATAEWRRGGCRTSTSSGSKAPRHEPPVLRTPRAPPLGACVALSSSDVVTGHRSVRP